MIKSYSGEGVVLSRKNGGEADRIITLYTKHHGKVRLLAKGVRKPKSKKRGHIEVFSKIKFSAVKGKSMDLVTEAELLESYDLLRQDLTKTTVAYYFCEVIDKVTREDEKNDNIYDDLIAYLKKIESTTKLKSLRSEFVASILIKLGFLTEVKESQNIDSLLSEVTEREINSVRIGKQVLT